LFAEVFRAGVLPVLGGCLLILGSRQVFNDLRIQESKDAPPWFLNIAHNIQPDFF